jgi:hypothetical protein
MALQRTGPAPHHENPPSDRNQANKRLLKLPENDYQDFKGRKGL